MHQLGQGCAGWVGQRVRDPIVVTFDRPEHEDEERDRDGGDPSAFGELRRQDDNRHDTRRERSDAIEDEASRPALLSEPPVVHDHPGLRERERHEQSHRE